MIVILYELNTIMVPGCSLHRDIELFHYVAPDMGTKPRGGGTPRAIKIMGCSSEILKRTPKRGQVGKAQINFHP